MYSSIIEMTTKIKKIKIPLRYLPRRLSKSDRKKQINMLMRSRKMYKMGNYYTRKKVKTFSSKPSNHIITARKLYNLDKIVPGNQLAKATGCTVSALNKIVQKGEGAYYSSGSRPNQTAQSWGLARLASSVTGGKAAAVDFHILETGCDHSKKAYRLAKKSGYNARSHTKRVVI